MYDIEVDKGELLVTLRDNKQKHVTEFEEASRNYRGKVVEALRARADSIEQGEEISVSFNLPQPRSYEDEYDDAIQMLDWHTGATVTLDRQQFKQYVQDEWTWTAAFAHTTSFYNS